MLCVCDDVAIPNNQSYIVERWMQCEQVTILTSHKVEFQSCLEKKRHDLSTLLCEK